MMSRVDPILPVVKSNQVLALHSSILGDIVDSEPRGSTCRIICFADKAFTMFLASVDHIPEMLSEHILGCISMMLQGVTYSLRDIGLVYDIHSPIACHEMRGRGKI